MRKRRVRRRSNRVDNCALSLSPSAVEIKENLGVRRIPSGQSTAPPYALQPEDKLEQREGKIKHFMRRLLAMLAYEALIDGVFAPQFPNGVDARKRGHA